MDANQVSWGQCPGVNQAPANGTLCFQSDESYLCFDDDTPKLTSYKCPLGGSIGTSADRTGNFCPYYKQRGAYRFVIFQIQKYLVPTSELKILTCRLIN